MDKFSTWLRTILHLKTLSLTLKLLNETIVSFVGAQMKTTHNLRLLCTDVLRLCQHKTHTVG